MKSRITFIVAIAALILCALLLIFAMVAYPMHIGEPTHFHVARTECLTAAAACALVAILSALWRI